MRFISLRERHVAKEQSLIALLQDLAQTENMVSNDQRVPVRKVRLPHPQLIQCKHGVTELGKVPAEEIVIE